jgi:hypothetical protein
MRPKSVCFPSLDKKFDLSNDEQSNLAVKDAVEGLERFIKQGGKMRPLDTYYENSDALYRLYEKKLWA